MPPIGRYKPWPTSHVLQIPVLPLSDQRAVEAVHLRA